jgi:hypothetical protein
MNYAFEMGSDSLIYIARLIKMCSAIQKIIGRIYTTAYRYTAM